MCMHISLHTPICTYIVIINIVTLIYNYLYFILWLHIFFGCIILLHFSPRTNARQLKFFLYFQICSQVAQACKARHIVGHFTVDFVTFIHPKTVSVA